MKTNHIYHGDVLEVLRSFPDECVHCCVTSPPYWGLRDYGIDKQLGMEATPEEYITRMVEIFREVRRVLRSDGTLWLNMGDCYAGSGVRAAHHKNPGISQSPKRGCTHGVPVTGNLKPKDLMGMPWMLAFALRNDGWWLRSDIIWAKPNPMPESVRDRPTKAHEYMFLLSKSKKYYYDQDAVREEGPTYHRKAGGYRGRNGQNASRFAGKGGFGDSDVTTTGRNLRDVWNIATQPFPEAHFATFPEKLVEPCIKAGTSEKGIVLDPFMGSGTTALVARKLGRNYIGIELNPEYIKIADKRLQQLFMF